MKNANLMNFIGAPGHHQYFLTDTPTKATIWNSLKYIRANGLSAFLDHEYPLRGTKRIIINQTGETWNVVDGNKHLVSILLENPRLTVNDLLRIRPDLVRMWNCGMEYEWQEKPYDIFIPNHIDTTLIQNTRCGYDYFKKPPEKIKIIPANIPFHSMAFHENDRGRPLWETVKALHQLLHG